jgi:adsorption protein B
VSEATIGALRLLFHGLRLVEHELLVFAAFWFVVGAIDELAVDCGWVWLRLTGRARDGRAPRRAETGPLSGPVAVLVPAWHEAEVIAAMVRHTLTAWPQRNLMLYVGCYCNDAETLAAAMQGAGDHSRVRLVIHHSHGPTTKADCLNRLYAGLCDDETRSGVRYARIVLHDAEDMVHPAALSVIDRALQEADFVQLPVRPEPQADSPWVAGHYSDEFAEAHAKSLVVRDALGAAIPAAGVGCGFARAALARLAEERRKEGEHGPFAADCLTEDYELGLVMSRSGAGSRFVRLRDDAGELVATRAYFPPGFDAAVRQKARWIHGIALQAWDRLGWSSRPVDIWMTLRDRRGPLTALVLAAAYGLLVLKAVLAPARVFGWVGAEAISPELRAMLAVSFAAFVWRAGWRFAFTAREYGLAEGLRAILRIPVANVITIVAGRRALVAYVRSLRGAEIGWEKTHHRDHPAALRLQEPAR